VWRAFYAPHTRKEKQILPTNPVESVGTMHDHTNRTNIRVGCMAVIEGVKSIRDGREVKLLTHSPYVISVAY
jgi:ribonuclease HI